MPVFHVTAPDGRVMEVTAPDGASQEDVIAYAQANMPPAPPAPQAPPEGIATKAAKAYGNAVAGPVETAAHLASGAVAGPAAGYAGLGAQALQSAESGNVTGPISAIAPVVGAVLRQHGINLDPSEVIRKTQEALTYQPRTEGGQSVAHAADAVGSVIPKAANAAGEATTDATGSPLLGAAVNTGLQGLGMAALGKLPAGVAALRDVPVIKPTIDFASDILPGGKTRAAGRLIQTYAGGEGAATEAAAAIKAHQDAQAALDAAGASGSLVSKYNISPTTAQVGKNAGLTQMDRTLRNQPEITTHFNDRDAANQAAINDILTGISGTAEDRLRAGAARDFKARTMYDDALNNPEHFVQPPDPAARSFEAEAASKNGLPNADGTPSTNDPNAPPSGLNDIGLRLQEVLKRPAVKDAMNNASTQAANRGVALDSRNLIQQMHYAKLHLDGQISAAMRSGDSTTLGGLLDSKNAMLGVMDDLSPAYAEARSKFSTASQPINRMDIGEALRQKYMSALADAGGTGTRPSQFAEALRKENGDALARSATDFSGAKMDKILTPQDMVDLAVARDQLARQQFAQTAGRGVGSNTGQNLANQRALDNVGSVNQVAEDMGPAAGFAAAMHHPGIAIPAAIAGGAARRGARAILTDAALNPEVARKLLLQRGTNRIPDSVVMPAAVGADSDSQTFADGGEVEPVKKFTFWDLAQQALKELAGGDKPQDVPLGTGASDQAAKQIEANPNRIMNQADAQS